jgi:hypothetical protein
VRFEKYVEKFGRNGKEERPLGRPKHGLEDHIKMNTGEVSFRGA